MKSVSLITIKRKTLHNTVPVPEIFVWYDFVSQGIWNGNLGGQAFIGSEDIKVVDGL